MPEEGGQAEQIFINLDLIITVVFVIELLINIFAHSNDGFKPFYSRPANWFDSAIVAVSLANVILRYVGKSLRRLIKEPCIETKETYHLSQSSTNTLQCSGTPKEPYATQKRALRHLEKRPIDAFAALSQADVELPNTKPLRLLRIGCVVG